MSHDNPDRSLLDPFAETEDQQALRGLAREVAERELLPNARHWDETEEFPEASWDAMRKADLFGITIGGSPRARRAALMPASSPDAADST